VYTNNRLVTTNLGFILLGMDINDPRRPPSDEELDELNEHWVEPYDPKNNDRADYFRNIAPAPGLPKGRVKKRHWVRALLILLLLAAIAGGAYYWFVVRTNSKSATTTQQKQTQPTVTKSTVKPTKHFDSANFSLGLDYPEDWTPVEDATKLTVTSPDISFTLSSGQKAQGKMVVTVRNKQTTLTEFAAGPGTAVLESEKIAYKKPTQNQRAQTYLTFVSYASDKANGLDAIYVAGDNGYQVGQAVPMTDVVQADPLINVTFVGATATSAYSVAPASWKDPAISDPVKTILQSLTIN
jgi:cytoskeletal protein RodZ